MTRRFVQPLRERGAHVVLARFSISEFFVRIVSVANEPTM